MKFEVEKYEFDEFTLEKEGNLWRLHGEKKSLSPSYTNILAKLIQKKHNTVPWRDIESRAASARKIIEAIRFALGSNYDKKTSRCKYIQTVHGEGCKWIYLDVRSYGKFSFLLYPVEVSNDSDKKELFLRTLLMFQIPSAIEKELNFESSETEKLKDPAGKFPCSIKVKSMYERGIFRLALIVSRHTGENDSRFIEIKGSEEFQVAKKAKIQIVQTLRELFPESIKNQKTIISKNYNSDSDYLETENTEAKRYFLQGELCWEKRDQENVEHGLEYFKKAVAADSEYLSAWIGIAKSYVILCLQGSEKLYPKNAIPFAIKALDKIEKPEKKHLLSNQQLSDIEAVKGLIYFIYEWNAEKSFTSFKKSLQKVPQNYMARTWYAQCLIRKSNVTEAVAEIEKAWILSGYTNSVTNTAYIQTLYFARKYEEAVSKAKEILELTPNLRLGHLFWGLAAREIGDIETALEHVKKASLLFQNSAIIGELGYTFALAGKNEEAEKMLAHLNKIRSQGNYASHYNDARIYVGLKKVDTCFEELEKAYEERSPWLVSLFVDPAFDSLKTDSRFNKLILRIH